MKYMIKSLSDKITAVFVYILLAEIAVALFLAIDCMIDYHFYAPDCATYAIGETCRVKTDDEFNKIEHFADKYLRCTDESAREQALKEFDSSYDRHLTNLVVIVRDENADVIFDNLNGEAFDSQKDACFSSVKAFSLCSEKGKIIDGTVSVHIRNGLPVKDSYRLAFNLIKIANVVKYPILAVLVLMIIAMITVLGMLMSSIGRSKAENAKPERFIDKIPFDLMIVIMAAIIALVAVLIVLTSVAGIKQNNLVLWNAVVLILTFIISSVLLVFSVTLATRIKYGHVYRNTLIFSAIAKIRKKAGKENDGYFKVPFVSKMLITIGSLTLIEILVTLYALFKYRTSGTNLLSDFKFTYFAFFQIILACILGPLFYMVAVNLYHVRVSGKKIASGDLDYTIDSHILFGDFREISEDFVDIKDDMIKALEEKNKSNEMRNELIANISHDLKTPLTSIINYSDIVSSGGCTDEELKNYLGIIGRQSGKLNELLQSLIEVSKLSSGVVEANFESLDICLYLSQIVDEFAYGLAEKGLEISMDIPEEELFIDCDSSMLWRIFENLINNICKYAMPGSRVFFEIKKEDEWAVIRLKNTSQDEITLSPEDLIQRFKRNDRSRTSGGNGLGLSIAKSFTEVQNGIFAVETDGDLFKSVLKFRLSGTDKVQK